MREQDGDQAAHDVGVAVALEMQHAAVAVPAPRASLASHTWLAQPRTLLVSLLSASGSGGRRAAKLDDVAVAILPVVEQGEIGADCVERHGGCAASVLIAKFVAACRGVGTNFAI